MKLDMKYVIPIVIIYGFTGFSAGVKYQERKERIKDENQCIKEMVQSGVERKHIFTHQGKCYLESPL